MAKITFGTGGMLDVVTGDSRPDRRAALRRRLLPDRRLAARRRTHVGARGGDAVGRHVRRVAARRPRPDRDAAESDAVAAACADTGDVWFVPALLGLGTPHWDFGARGTLVGLTRGTARAHVVRAVLEGIAHRGADLVEAAEADGHTRIESLRVDGGMSANATFVQALADACRSPGRGVARARGHHARRRVPRRPRRRHVVGRGRDRRTLEASPGRRAAQPRPAPRPLGRRRGSALPRPSPSSAPSTSEARTSYRLSMWRSALTKVCDTGGLPSRRVACQQIR